MPRVNVIIIVIGVMLTVLGNGEVRAQTPAEQPSATPPPAEALPAPRPTPDDDKSAPSTDPGTSPKPATDAPASAFGGPSPFFQPAVGHTPLRIDDRFIGFPLQPVSGQATHLGYIEDDLNVSFPLWQNACDEFSGGVGVRGEFFRTAAILPDTDQPFPDELWNIRLSTTYRHLFDNGWVAGGTVSVGSASDRPFAGISEMTAGVNAFLRIPSGEHNAWLLSLSYSPTAELAFPIPGVAYLWQPSDRLRLNVGLPFQVWWHPTDELTFDASYMLLRTVHARATYRLWGPLCAFAGYDWANESYFLVDRPTSDDRFFYYDQRLTGGLQAHLGAHALVEAAAGYVFDRFYFEGRSFSDQNFDRIDVGTGPFASLRFELRY